MGKDLTISYNELLVNFVKKKNELFLSQTKIPYINTKDIEDILNWDSFNAMEVYCRIKKETETRYYRKKRGLSSRTCPWCILFVDILHTSCKKCSYGINHINDKYNIYEYEVFINYKKIIEEIETKYF